MASVLLNHQLGLTTITLAMKAAGLHKSNQLPESRSERLAFTAILLYSYWTDKQANRPNHQLSLIGSDVWPDHIMPKPIQALKIGMSIAKNGGTDDNRRIVRDSTYLAWRSAGCDLKLDPAKWRSQRDQAPYIEVIDASDPLARIPIERIITSWPYDVLSSLDPKISRPRFTAITHSICIAIANMLEAQYYEVI
jgi:hypothetical protein